MKAREGIENRKIVEFVSLDSMLGYDLNLALEHDLRIAVANHRVRAAHADQRNQRANDDCRNRALAKTALQNEQEYDRNRQSRDFEDREAGIFLQARFEFLDALLQCGMLARLF